MQELDNQEGTHEWHYGDNKVLGNRGYIWGLAMYDYTHRNLDPRDRLLRTPLWNCQRTQLDKFTCTY